MKKLLLIFGVGFAAIIVMMFQWLLLLSVIRFAYETVFVPEVPEIPDPLLEVDWSRIKVNSIEESEYTEEELLEMGISPEQARDIIKHPDRYRRVVFYFQYRNHSDVYGVGGMEIDKHLPEEAKKRLIWMSGLTWGHVHEGEDVQPDWLEAIFKLEEGESEDDLKAICKRIRFTLTGVIVDPAYPDDSYGSISETIRYRGD